MNYLNGTMAPKDIAQLPVITTMWLCHHTPENRPEALADLMEKESKRGTRMMMMMETTRTMEIVEGILRGQGIFLRALSYQLISPNLLVPIVRTTCASIGVAINNGGHVLSRRWTMWPE